MYVAILCLIYLLTQSKELKNKKVLRKIAFSIICIVVITSFFWAPLLEHRIATEYEVFKPGRMERTEVLIAFKLSFADLFITKPDSIMIYEIGLINVVLLVLSPIVIKKLKTKWKNTDFYRFYMYSLITGLICCIMTLKIFPFEHLPALLKMLQFSFRLLEFSSFFFAFAAAVNFYMLLRNNKLKNILILILIALLMVSTVLFKSHLHFVDEIDETKLWPAVRVTSQTGRVHPGCASFEYLPCKAFENRSYIENRADEVIVLNGNAQIENQNKANTNLNCKLLNATEETEIELPYIYYLGYKVTLEQDGVKTKLNTFETENGFVGVKIPTLEEANLQVHYEGTFVMKVSAIISIIGGIALISYIGIFYFRRR